MLLLRRTTQSAGALHRTQMAWSASLRRGLAASAETAENLSLDAQHRHRIGIDLQNMSTPTGKSLVKDMVKDMWPKRKGDRAGLLIPFCHVNGKANLAFVFRPEDREMNSCSFPYEMHGKDDHSLVVTSMRSAFKDLGVLPTSIEVVGTMTEARDGAGSVTITPVVAYIGEVGGRKLAPGRESDVSGSLLAPVEELLTAERLKYRDIPNPPFLEPYFLVDQGDGQSQVKIQGLTAMLLHGILRVVVGRDRNYIDVLYRPFIEAMKARQ